MGAGVNLEALRGHILELDSNGTKKTLLDLQGVLSQVDHLFSTNYFRQQAVNREYSHMPNKRFVLITDSVQEFR